MAEDKKIQIIAENRKAKQRYHVEDEYEAGIQLVGSEVKALRQGHCQIVDSYAHIRDYEIYLLNLHISLYSHGGYVNHEPTRTRKLLLHKQEIYKLNIQLERRGYTLVPLLVYFKEGKAKVRLGLCSGKNEIDRRQEIKKRENDRELAQIMKNKIKS